LLGSWPVSLSDQPAEPRGTIERRISGKDRRQRE
jgi:hypothetical protein